LVFVPIFSLILFDSQSVCMFDFIYFDFIKQKNEMEISEFSYDCRLPFI